MTSQSTFFIPQSLHVGVPTAAEVADGLRDVLRLGNNMLGSNAEASFDTFTDAFVSGEPSIQRKVYKVTVEEVTDLG